MEQFIGFWDLTKEQQERLAADGMLNIRTFGKRQVLMNQDDDADNVGVMLSGTAFLESMNQEGQRRILDYYEPKESFTRKCFPDVEGRMLRHFAFQLPGRFFEWQKAVVGL